MKNCHVCATPCEDNAEICSKCGAQLATFEEYMRELEKKQQEEKQRVADPVLAVSPDNVVTAEIYKDVLSENGIAYTYDEREEGMHMAFGGSFFAVDIYVAEEDLERARELYEDVVNSEPEFDGDFEGFEDAEEIDTEV